MLSFAALCLLACLVRCCRRTQPQVAHRLRYDAIEIYPWILHNLAGSVYCRSCPALACARKPGPLHVELLLRCAGLTAQCMCWCRLLQAPQLLRELLEREVGEHISHLEKRRQELVRHVFLHCCDLNSVLVCQFAWNNMALGSGHEFSNGEFACFSFERLMDLS